MVIDPNLMGHAPMRDALTGQTVRSFTGMFRPTVPGYSVRVFVIDEDAICLGQYKRMKEG